MSRSAVTRIEGDDSYRQATAKARYGHNDWLVYQTPTGQVAERKSPESMKRCLLASGTKKGSWTLITSDGVSTVGFWWLGLNLIRQMKRGIY